MAKRWSQEELGILKENYTSLGATKCAELLPGRAITSIKAKASSLGLKVSSNKKIERTTLEASLKKFYQEYNRVPSVQDCKNCDYLSSYSAYNREFGGITKAAELLELEHSKTNKYANSKSDENLLKGLVRFYKEMGRLPKSTECTSQHPYLAARGVYANRFGSWRKSVELAFLKEQITPEVVLVKISKVDVIDKIKKFYEDKGRPPLKEDFVKAKETGLPSYPIVLKFFKGVSEALREAGVPLHTRSNIYTEQELLESLKRFYREEGRSPLQEECVSNKHDYLFCATTYLLRFGSFSKALEKAELPIREPGRSVQEQEVLDFISNNYKGLIEKNVRLTTGVEFDIILPDLKLAIEYNGLYWHSDQHKDNKYHLNKTKIANSLGYTLIHIFENEWLLKQDIVKSRLLYKLGLISNKIYARKCIIKDISSSDSEVFLNKNHIQGYATSSIRLGLEHNEELVAIMTFSKARFSNTAEWELVRYTNKLNTTVVGGASKLFAHFVKAYSPCSIISYADIRWNSGSLYSNLDFKWSHDSKPNYWYFKGKILESRIKYQKHKLQHILKTYDQTLTEYQNMCNNGYYRIFDCGNKVFLWE